jgi:hypothetical protein
LYNSLEKPLHEHKITTSEDGSDQEQEEYKVVESDDSSDEEYKLSTDEDSSADDEEVIQFRKFAKKIRRNIM